MNRWSVVLVPVEPVSIGQGLAWANVQTTAPYIPGSSWRGALARALLAAEGVSVGSHWAGRSLPPELQGVWDRLFFHEQAPRYGFLYPVGSAQASWVAAGRVWAFAPPLSARSCKYHPGYKDQAGERGSPGSTGHGVADLVLRALREFLEGPERQKAGGASVAPDRRKLLCPVRHERMERFKKLSVMAWEEPAGATFRFASAAPPMRYLTRVGIDRSTSTASESLLYSLQVMEPAGHVFVGNLRATDAQLQELMSRAARIPAEQERTVLRVKVRVGAARARGLGLAWIVIRRAEEEMGSLQERLDSFQPRRLVGAGTGEVVRLGPVMDEAHLYFSLTLRSPAIVRSPQGVPTTEVSPGVLEAYGFTVPSGLEWIRQASFVDPEVVSGWSLAWGLPKPTTLALAAGSVLTYRAPARERDAVLSLLEELEERGLGERVREGYGEVQVCFPFHRQLDYDLQQTGDSTLAREEAV